jgi:hypothetical protein
MDALKEAIESDTRVGPLEEGVKKTWNVWVT